MASIADLVHQTSASTGTGNLTLSSVNGKQTFNGAFGNGATTNVFYYFISNQGAAEYEIGTGHMSDATTLVRDTVLGGSSGTSAVNFSAGTKDVTNDIPASLQSPLIAAGGSALALQSTLDALSLTTSVLALQVADLTNVALFPDPNNVFDSFDALTYVDSAGATNLDTSASGILKPTSVHYTKLLLHCDGTDASTTFTDSSSFAHSVTANGNAQVDTAQSKFGGASLAVDGTGDYLSSANSSDFDFGTGDFTIDLWVRRNGAQGNFDMLLTTGEPVSGSQWSLRWKTGNTLEFQGGNPAGAQALITGVTTIADATWTHVAVVRSGNTGTLYLDGVSDATGDFTGVTVNSNARGLRIGMDLDNTGSLAYNGWLDEIRISKGIARWTAGFTPPVAAYTDDVVSLNMTVSSTSFTAASAPAAMKAVIRVKEVDAATAGTDYTLEVSRDGGTTWTAATLTELFTSPSPTASIRVCETNEVDVSGQPSGTSPRWRFKTLNNKGVELHDVALYWG